MTQNVTPIMPHISEDTLIPVSAVSEEPVVEAAVVPHRNISSPCDILGSVANLALGIASLAAGIVDSESTKYLAAATAVSQSASILLADNNRSRVTRLGFSTLFGLVGVGVGYAINAIVKTSYSVDLDQQQKIIMSTAACFSAVGSCMGAAVTPSHRR